MTSTDDEGRVKEERLPSVHQSLRSTWLRDRRGAVAALAWCTSRRWASWASRSWCVQSIRRRRAQSHKHEHVSLPFDLESSAPASIAISVHGAKRPNMWPI